MSAAAQSPAELAAHLLVDFCVPVARGETRVDLSGGSALGDEQRRAIGISTPGDTYAFPARGASVFLDLNADRVQVWFVHPEARTCQELVERALLQRYPQFRFVKAVEAKEPGRWERYFGADFGENVVVQIDMGFPTTDKASNFFVLKAISMKVVDRKALAKALK
jgi:hypothetical protein